MNLTPRQLQVLQFIEGYERENVVSPILDEIAAALRVHKVTVHEHLAQLERKGYIRRERQRSRGIEVLRPSAPRPDLLFGVIVEERELDGERVIVIRRQRPEEARA